MSSPTWAQRREAAIRSAATAAIRDPEASPETVEAAIAALEPAVQGAELLRQTHGNRPARIAELRALVRRWRDQDANHEG